MMKMGCVIGWAPDPEVKGATNLRATTCSTMIAGLSMVIARMQLGEELNEAEIDIVNTCIEMYGTGELLDASA